MIDDPFPGSSADFYERIQVLKATIEEQQAEITRLGTINSSRTFLYLEARSLITELCDALDGCFYGGFAEAYPNDPRVKLLQHARKATR